MTGQETPGADGRGGSDRGGSDRGGTDRGGRRTTAEWLLFGFSALLVFAVLAVLVGDWLSGSSRPAGFRTRVHPVVVRDGQYRVPVTVENTGDQAAADVRIAAELEVGGALTEASSTVDFLAPGEERRVTFVFARDPRQGRLSVSVSSFREP